MPEYLIDNSVLHGRVNTKDKHHSVCKKFFDEHKDDKLFFTIHSMFEFKSSRERRMKGNDFEELPEVFLGNQMSIDINKELYLHCEEEKLFEKFKDLKAGDLIYACIAYI